MNMRSILRVTVLTIVLTSIIVTIQYKIIPRYQEYKAAQDFKLGYTVPNNNKFKILMIWAHGLGEKELIARYKIATKNLGIEYRAVATMYNDDKLVITAERYANKHNTTLADMAIAAMQPDLIITVQHCVDVYKGAPNYRVMDVTLASYIETDSDGTIKFNDKKLYEFDGLLTVFDEIDQVKAIYEAQGKKFYGMNWYPTSYVNNLKPAEPTRLFYIGGEYGVRNSEKYATVIKMLDQQDYLDVAASKQDWKSELHHIRPRVPFDGVSLINEFNKTGIALVIHDASHLNGAAPTGRIFEAAAGNSVIISDQNGFIKKNFGDNVLYIDVTQSAEDMYKQIDKHMQWILRHPQQAQAMAQACHDTFLQKFTLEAQLQRLIQLHKARIAEQQHG